MRLLKCWGGIVHTQNKQSICKEIDQKSSAVPRTVRVVFIYMAGCPTAPAGHTPSSSSAILHPCPCPGLCPTLALQGARNRKPAHQRGCHSQNHALKKISPQNENNYTGGENGIN